MVGSGFSALERMMENPITPDEFRAALGRFASGVTVVTVATADGEVHGMTANAFCSVSLQPPLVLVCVDHLAETYLHLREHERFGISVLKEDQEALSEFFADPERNPDAAYRLGIEYGKMTSGTPVLRHALANLDCRKTAAHAAGRSHDLCSRGRRDYAWPRCAAAVFSRTIRHRSRTDETAERCGCAAPHHALFSVRHPIATSITA